MICYYCDCLITNNPNKDNWVLCQHCEKLCDINLDKEEEENPIMSDKEEKFIDWMCCTTCNWYLPPGQMAKGECDCGARRWILSGTVEEFEEWEQKILLKLQNKN